MGLEDPGEAFLSKPLGVEGRLGAGRRGDCLPGCGAIGLAARADPDATQWGARV